MKLKKKNTKKVIGGFFTLILIAVLIGFASAEDYCILKMTKGQKIQITATDFYTCKHTLCQVCATASIPHWYSSNPYRCKVLCDSSSGVPNQSLTLSVNWPFSDNGIFTKQSFFMDIATNKISSIYMIDNIAGKQRNLCPNCNSYRKSVNFKQGLNDITIRAVKGLEVKETSIKFFIDNQKPRISRTLPASNKYANGSFVVYYDEANLKKVELSYGETSNILKKELTGCESGKAKSCSTYVDLSAFDGKTIDYWFTITDIADNSVSSRSLKILVDKTAPVINAFTHNVSKTYATFNISITEKNFDKIVYYDNGETRQRILCSGTLRNNLCTKRLSFRKGSHNVEFVASDKAGNTARRTVQFEIA